MFISDDEAWLYWLKDSLHLNKYRFPYFDDEEIKHHAHIALLFPEMWATTDAVLSFTSSADTLSLFFRTQEALERWFDHFAQYHSLGEANNEIISNDTALFFTLFDASQHIHADVLINVGTAFIAPQVFWETHFSDFTIKEYRLIAVYNGLMKWNRSHRFDADIIECIHDQLRLAENPYTSTAEAHATYFEMMSDAYGLDIHHTKTPIVLDTHHSDHLKHFLRLVVKELYAATDESKNSMIGEWQRAKLSSMQKHYLSVTIGYEELLLSRSIRE